MNTSHRKLIDGEKKYIMLRNNNNAVKRLLRNIKQEGIWLKEGYISTTFRNRHASCRD